MRQNVRKHKIRKPLSVVLAAALAAVIAVPAASSAARADGDCSLTVSIGSEQSHEYADDLTKKGNLKFDLYQIAKGSPDGTYDTWHWTLTGAYAEDKNISFDENTITAEGYNELAFDAAQIALADGADADKVGYVTGKSLSGSSWNVLFDDLDEGLYLLIPRDTNKTDGSDILRDSKGNITGMDIDSADWSYTFEPTIVSLPGKEADENGMVGTAAQYGEWKYAMDINIVLKIKRDVQDGSIKITKTLLNYETKDPVTVSFNVRAVRGTNEDGTENVVYDDEFSMVFGDEDKTPATRTNEGYAGKKVGYEEKVIEGLPVGSVVTVTEDYAGAACKQVTSVTPDNPVVTADEILTFEYTNNYDETYKGGGGVENQYVFDAADGDMQKAHWIPKQVRNGKEYHYDYDEK